VNVEKFIRDAAKRQWSRQQTREALEMGAAKFNAILECLPDVIWPAAGRSIAHQRAHQQRRGIDTPALKRAREIHQAKRREQLMEQTNGLHALVKNSPVHRNTVRNRVARGMSLEQALTMPAMAPSARRRGLTI
jgi:hypothetical protein